MAREDQSQVRIVFANLAESTGKQRMPLVRPIVRGVQDVRTGHRIGLALAQDGLPNRIWNNCELLWCEVEVMEKTLLRELRWNDDRGHVLECAVHRAPVLQF